MADVAYCTLYCRYFVYFESIRTSLFGDIRCVDSDGVTAINMILAETACRYRMLVRATVASVYPSLLYFITS